MRLCNCYPRPTPDTQTEKHWLLLNIKSGSHSGPTALRSPAKPLSEAVAPEEAGPSGGETRLSDRCEAHVLKAKSRCSCTNTKQTYRGKYFVFPCILLFLVKTWINTGTCFRHYFYSLQKELILKLFGIVGRNFRMYDGASPVYCCCIKYNFLRRLEKFSISRAMA